MNTVEAVTKLKKEFNENINSHVFLVETDNVDLCLDTIKELVIDLIGTDNYIKHQIINEEYIEMEIIRPEGKEIKRDQILDLQKKLKVKPVIGDMKIYIITPAEAMNDVTANKLLKTMEDPNPNTLGFLITTNSDLILPTVKSRCEYLSILYNDQQETKELNDEVHNLAKKIIIALEEKDFLSLMQIKNSSSLKENARDIEKIIKKYYNTACKLQKNTELEKEIVDLILKKNTEQELVKKIKYLETAINKLSHNMNFELLLDKIFFEFKDVK